MLKNQHQTLSLFLIFIVLTFLWLASRQNEPAKQTEIPSKMNIPDTPKAVYPPQKIPIEPYTENPELEAIFQKQANQPHKQKISLDFPQPTHRHVLKNNQFLFKIKGRWIGKENPPKTLFVSFYSNEVDDFQQKKPLAAWQVKFKKTEVANTFRVSEILLERWKGLYYYVIEELETKEILFVGKTELL